MNVRLVKIVPSANRSRLRPLGATIVVLVASANFLLLGSRSPVAHASTPSTLQQKISAGENRISALSGTVSMANAHLRQLNASIARLQSEVVHVQSKLDANRAELLRLRRELNAATIRLTHLQARERTARYVLAQQLVANYEGDPPDMVSVMLESNGFSSLLERLSFAQRVRLHDQQVVVAVKLAQQRVNAQVIRLGGLEARQRAVTAHVLAERNRVYAAKVTLVKEQISVKRTRDAKAGQLATTRGQVASLRRQLKRLEAEQAAALNPDGAAVIGASHPVGSDPIPGFTIGRDDMGVDATAPPGTGIYAPVTSRLVEVLPNWYEGEPLLLFQFASLPPGAPSDYWYVAEQIDPVTTSLGTTFQAGQRVASFASSGTGIEIGWGSPSSTSRTLAGETDPGAASPPAGSATSWGESFKELFGIG